MAVLRRSTFRSVVALVLALSWASVGNASLETTGVWEAGVWDTTVWADGVWREGGYEPAEAQGGSAPRIGLGIGVGI